MALPKQNRPMPQRSAAEESAAGPQLSLRSIILILRKRAWLVLSIVFAAAAASVGIVMNLTPTYTAETVLMIQSAPMEAFSRDLTPTLDDMVRVRTEAEVLKSLTLAKDVVERLNLRRHTGFQPNPSSTEVVVSKLYEWGILPQWLQQSDDEASGSQSSAAEDASTTTIAATEVTVSSSQSEIAELLAPEAEAGSAADASATVPVDEEPSAEGATPAEAKQDPFPSLENVALQLRSQIGVHSDGRSAILKIRFEAEDPLLAANVANTYATAYIAEQLATKKAALQRTNDWLMGRLDQLRRNVRVSERAVQNFRYKNQMSPSGSGTTVVAQQLAELNSELIQVRAGRAHTEARLGRIHALVANAQSAQVAQEILTSPWIIELKERQAEAQNKVAELRSRFGQGHPSVLEAEADKADIEQKLEREVNIHVASIANEVEVSRAREAALLENLAEVERKAHEVEGAQGQLQELERESAADRQLFETFLARSKEITGQKNFQQPDARVISEATVPVVPTFPKKSRIVGLAVLMSLVAAFGIGFLVESMDSTFGTLEEMETVAGLPAFGLVPEVDRGRSGISLIISNPTSIFSEAVRSVRVSLGLSGQKDQPKVVLVTSSDVGDGKSVLSASLARSAAQSGQRVVLIDCDLRHPTIGNLFGNYNAIGLEAYLDGSAGYNANLDDLTCSDPASGLRYISARAGASNPEHLLGSLKLSSLVSKLREDADLIVIDAPPILPVADALILAKVADATILAVRWNSTPRSSLVSSLRQIRKIAALKQKGLQLKVIGLVMTRVNLNKYAVFSPAAYSYFGDREISQRSPARSETVS